MIRPAAALLCLGATAATADVLVPSRTIRPREIISAQDILVKSATVPGALSDPDQAIGLEARVALYPGRPLREGDVGTPALVGRNEIVTLVFRRGGLSIVTEGRALDRAGEGDPVRVMNLASRSTVTGVVRADGTIEVR